MNYLLDNDPELVEESIIKNESFAKRIKKLIKKNSPGIDIPLKDAGGLLLDRSDLSQRGYKNLKSILNKQNVQLPSYDSVQSFLKNLLIGQFNVGFANATTMFVCLVVLLLVKH